MASNYQELLNWKRGGGRGGGGRRVGEDGERTEESCLRFKRGGRDSSYDSQFRLVVRYLLSCDVRHGLVT